MPSPTGGSDELLTEIMLLLRDLNKEAKKNSKAVADLDATFKKLDKKIDDLVKEAFVDGDVQSHNAWHKNFNNRKGFLARLLRR